MQPDATLCQRIAVLEAENVDLRERIAHLERDIFCGLLCFPPEWRLTASEQRVFAALLSRPQTTKDQLLTALYREHAREEAEIKIVDVFVCKLRKKLTPFGISIRTIWGQGYAVDEPRRGLLKTAMAPDADPIAARRTFGMLIEVPGEREMA